MPKDLIKEIGAPISLEEEKLSYRQGEPRWKSLAREGVGFAYDAVVEPIRSYDRLVGRLQDRQLPQDMTEQESQQSLEEGPPTLGKAVGAVSDVVSDFASLLPVVGEEAIVGKLMGKKALGAAAAAGITKTARGNRWKEIFKQMYSKGRRRTDILLSKKAVLRMEKIIPEEFWAKRIGDIEPADLQGVLGRYMGGTRRVIVDPAEMRSGTLVHEVGHAVSHFMFDVAEPGTALSRLRGLWENMKYQATGLEGKLQQLQHLDGITSQQVQQLRQWEIIAWKASPEEMFARAWEKAVVQGKQNFRDATKTAARVVNETIEKSADVMDKIDDVVRAANRSADQKNKLKSLTTAAFEAGDDLLWWLKDSKYRKEHLIAEIERLYIKENPGATVAALEEFTGNLKYIEVNKLHDIWLRHTKPARLSGDIVSEMKDGGKYSKEWRKARAKWEAQLKKNKEISKRLDERLAKVEEMKKAGEKFGPGGELRYKHESDENLYKIIKDARREKKRTLVTKATVERHRELKMKVLDATDELGRREGLEIKGGKLSYRAVEQMLSEAMMKGDDKAIAHWRDKLRTMTKETK